MLAISSAAVATTHFVEGLRHRRRHRPAWPTTASSWLGNVPGAT
jgi:hypothetical protein